jgi:hypothetical protein
MLMKRSVDKGGGRFTEPQPADIALYCMRWGGSICGDDLRSIATPEPGRGLELEPHIVASPALLVRSQTTTPYRYLVVTCESIPGDVITPDQVESDSLLAESESGCVRAPAGILFHIHLSDGATELALTGRDGEFVFQKPDGIGVEVDMPEGAYGRFPSLLGYQPLDVFDRIPADVPDCERGTPETCTRVYVLVP